MTTPPLDVAGAFRGRHLVLTGATGFVGKTVLAWLLCHHPDIGKITCVIRGKARKTPRQRLDGLFDGDAMAIVRETYGAALPALLAEKLGVVDGDLGRPRLGISEADFASLQGASLVLHVAASVDFTPPLDQALQANAEGALEVLGLARALGARLVHVSTCYVAGLTSGLVREEVDAERTPNGTKIDAERELNTARRLVERIQEDKDDPVADSARRRLRRDGEARARALGWPNTYTYTKSLGEKLLVRNQGEVPLAIARLAIVESAVSFPLRGWSEGGNGSAACILLARLGQRWNPSVPDLVLDLVPVDHVARALVLIAAAVLRGRHQLVYHVGTSDENPLQMRRVTELVNVARHRMADEPGRTALEKAWLRFGDSVPGQRALYDRTSAPAIQKLASKVSGLLDGAPIPEGPLARFTRRARAIAEAVDRTAKGVDGIYDVYGPFIHDVDVVYRTAGLRAASAMLGPDEQVYRWNPGAIDWYPYFQDVHLPGLDTWIFPEMLRKLKVGITPDVPSPMPIQGDALDLLERTLVQHPLRPAVGRVQRDLVTTWTWAELVDRARRGAQILAERGVAPGDRVLLQIDRSPAWPLAWFAVQYAGAVAVPVDPALSAEVVDRLAARANVRARVLSRRLVDDPDAAGVITAERLEAATSAHDPSRPEPAAFPRDPKRPASILFTSGTTGDPRGVVLTHANLMAVLRGVRGVYDLTADDRFLSLLPLHHAFEFSAGFLYPLSLGASVIYPAKVSAEDLPELLQVVQPTALVAVPALWTSLRRAVRGNIDALPAPVAATLDALASWHGTVRATTGVNVGPLLFAPVHRRLGSLRHLVSGGAALPESVRRDFYAWGFDLTSGYGLTEAGPVLTVAAPGDDRAASVGAPIAGVEVKIVDPGPDGIGEVVARGPNVMEGYLDDPAGTASAIKRGWLHTGDLGRIEDGQLLLAGRAKEVIVSSSGENVYPDELEELLLHRIGGELAEVAAVALADDAGGERLVVVAVPGDAAIVGDAPAEKKLRAAIVKVAAERGGAWRPSEVRFRVEPLPRTATRKVQRGQVAAWCRETAITPTTTGPAAPEARWLIEALARVADRDPATVGPHTRIGVDVPIDSLAWVDVAGVIERRLGRAPPVDQLAALATVGEVIEAVLGARSASRAAKVPLFYGADGRPLDGPPQAPQLEVPTAFAAPLAAFGRRLHARTTGALLDVTVTGDAYVPQGRPVLVVANHSSHVDSGVLRHALGALGDELPLLAAQDYFFGTPLKDFLFGDLLDLVPADRQGVGLSGVRHALRILREGRSLAVFPEGTRSRDGTIARFRPGAVLVALEAGVDVLPVYLGGTHDVLPAEGGLPRGRRVTVRIGRAVPHAWLFDRVRVRGESLQDAADLLSASVVALSEGQDSLSPWAEARRGAEASP